MKVKLLSYTPEPDKVVSMAAKLCYSPVGVDEIEENLTDEAIEKFLTMLMSMGHGSPIEHVSFTFAIEGISRACSHQLVRHRIASYSQQSQRYVRLHQFDYIIPPAIQKNKTARDIFITAMESDQRTYDELVETLMLEEYQKLVLKGKYSEKKARSMAEKKAIEDARYVFPNACETKLVVTMNARSLLHFFEHRACDRAQWEIREVADAMIKESKAVAPILFKNAGPSCVSGACPEGTMSCGLMKEMRDKYKNLI